MFADKRTSCHCRSNGDKVQCSKLLTPLTASSCDEYFMRTSANMTAAIVLVLASVLYFPSPRQAKRGEMLESWETSNHQFRIRITSFGETGAYLMGTYYVFSAAPNESHSWTEIMTVRHDDRPEIPKNQVRFVDSTTAYLFMTWMFAITRDGGKSWHVWNAKNDLPGWRCCNYQLITDVHIQPDGSGVMNLAPISRQRREPDALSTKDYGITWRSN